MLQPLRRMKLIVVAAAFLPLGGCEEAALTGDETKLAQEMVLPNAVPAAVDPSNAYAGNLAAAELGKALFFDTRFSGSGTTACATCHDPEKGFQDSLPLAVAAGTNTRRTMPLAGVAYSPWFFWDGRADSLWAQALGPIENPVEHATDRATVARQFLENYAEQYRAVFGEPPALGAYPNGGASPLGNGLQRANWGKLTESERDSINRVFANLGKSIAAFEAGIGLKASKFDEAFDGGEARLSEQETKGLKLFLGKANCVTCHTGARFRDDHFHNTGVPEVPGLPEDDGRAAVLRQVKGDPFNCLGPYSDAAKNDCRELRFMSTDDHALLRAYKTPSLRGVASRAPFMHAGQFKSLEDVLDHYSAAPDAPRGESELKPLSLDDAEKAAIAAFLRTLD